MKRAIQGLALMLTLHPALADEGQDVPWYEVEIILFEHLDPDAATAEQWPLDVISPDPDGTIALQGPAPGPQTTDHGEEAATEPDDPGAVPYQLLPPAQLRLRDAFARLASSDAYLPRLHIAWRQPVPPRETPDRIFIHDGLDDAPQPPTLAGPESVPPVTAAPTAALPLAETDPSGAADDDTVEHALSGVVNIGLGRYLHVNADLLLYRPRTEVEDSAGAMDDAPPAFALPAPVPEPAVDHAARQGEMLIEDAPEEVATPEMFRIGGAMRMRSGEVHYLDHPLAGMLILFTPYTPPEPVEVETKDAASSVPGAPRIDINQGESLPVPQ